MLNVQTSQPRKRNRMRCDIKDPKTFEIAERFQKYQRKTTENILEMCRIVVEAKGREDFEDFCLLIGYDECSSSIRKLHSIGLKYSYLISISNRLPPNWTVLYEISRMDESAIERYISNNSISPKTTTSRVEKLLIEQNLKSQSKSQSISSVKGVNQPLNNSVPNRTSSSIGFSAELTNLGNINNLFDLDEILNDLRKMGFELTISEELLQAINESKTLELVMEVV